MNLQIGDNVNWRTKNSRGNPCSRRAFIYFEPRDAVAFIYAYGIGLRRVQLTEISKVKEKP